jgi:hypothetical protein
MFQHFLPHSVFSNNRHLQVSKLYNLINFRTHSKSPYTWARQLMKDVRVENAAVHALEAF